MSWEKVKLTELCEINVGKTPSRDKSDYFGVGESWASIADMNGVVYLTNTKEQVTKEGILSANMKLVPKNTVIFSFKLSVGKVCITGKPLYTNEAIAALPIKNLKTLDTKYLYYAMQAQDFSHLGERAAKGLTLNKEKLTRIKIPLPPIPIQQKIAAILDLADALRKKDKQLLAKYDDLLQAVFYEMFGDPVKNEKGWEVKTIEELVKKEKYSIKRGPFGGALKKEIFVPNGFLVYEQFHALNNDFSFERYYIDDKKFEELKAFEVKPGDIIISCSGIYLGKLAIVPADAKKGIINQALLKISLDNEIMSNQFFVHLFTKESFREKFFGDTRGSGIPNFPPMEEFREFKFIYPPKELQEKFDLLSYNILQQKKQLKQQLQQSEALFQSLLQRAFKGELVNE